MGYGAGAGAYRELTEREKLEREIQFAINSMNYARNLVKESEERLTAAREALSAHDAGFPS